MPTPKEIETLVLNTVAALAEDFEIDVLRSPTPESALYGEGGALDSMALVNLIADLEESVAETFGAEITLADERAMSARKSPFRSVASLAEAAAERIAS